MPTTVKLVLRDFNIPSRHILNRRSEKKINATLLSSFTQRNVCFEINQGTSWGSLHRKSGPFTSPTADPDEARLSTARGLFIRNIHLHSSVQQFEQTIYSFYSHLFFVERATVARFYTLKYRRPFSSKMYSIYYFRIPPRLRENHFDPGEMLTVAGVPEIHHFKRKRVKHTPCNLLRLHARIHA